MTQIQTKLAQWIMKNPKVADALTTAEWLVMRSLIHDGPADAKNRAEACLVPATIATDLIQYIANYNPKALDELEGDLIEDILEGRAKTLARKSLESGHASPLVLIVGMLFAIAFLIMGVLADHTGKQIAREVSKISLPMAAETSLSNAEAQLEARIEQVTLERSHGDTAHGAAIAEWIRKCTPKYQLWIRESKRIDICDEVPEGEGFGFRVLKKLTNGKNALWEERTTYFRTNNGLYDDGIYTEAQLLRYAKESGWKLLDLSSDIWLIP